MSGEGSVGRPTGRRGHARSLARTGSRSGERKQDDRGLLGCVWPDRHPRGCGQCGRRPVRVQRPRPFRRTLRSDPENVSRDDLVFRVGTIHLVNLIDEVSVFAFTDCTAMVQFQSTSTIEGGTGQFHRRHRQPEPHGHRLGSGARRNPDAAAPSSSRRSPRSSRSKRAARCRFDDRSSPGLAVLLVLTRRSTARKRAYSAAPPLRVRRTRFADDPSTRPCWEAK